MAAHVEFRGVCKSYDGRAPVVRDLDLTADEGELVTLLGPSGSGKTTCLMMLAGFEAPHRRRHPHRGAPRGRGAGPPA